MSSLFRCLLTVVTLLLLGVSPSVAQDKGKNKKDKGDAAQQADVNALMVAIDGLMAGNAGESTLPLKWEQHHFIKAVGSKTYVPFTLTIDPPAFTASTTVGIYIRVVKHGDTTPAPPPAADPKKSKDKAAAAPAPQYPFDYGFFMDVSPATPGQPQRIRRAFDVEPGDYDVYIAVREKAKDASTPVASLRAGTLKQSVSVPAYAGNELTTSSIIVADKVDVLTAPLSSDHQGENPYTFGQIKLTPSVTNKFTTKDDLNVFFWIYGEQMDPATKKPNMTVDFSFSRKLPEGGEKFFNRTEPEELSASTLPEALDFSAGAVPVPGSLQVPLGGQQPFPLGDYHLEIKITDKVSGKTVSRDVTFTVAPSAVQ